MTTNNNEKWYVAYTMPRSEKKVGDALTKIGVTSFFPVHFVLRQWSDRIKKIELPMFPNYVFIHVNPKLRYRVLDVKDVIRYVSFDGQPAIVPDSVVDSLKKLSASNVEVSTEKFDKVGTPVMVCEGPFAGVKGLLVKKNGRSQLVIEVHSLGSAVLLEISASAVVCLDDVEADIYEEA
jgi:transcription antitermination factor NusG